MSAPYHLPLTLGSAESFIERRAPLDEAIEAAGMFAALTHLKQHKTRAELERLIREAFPLFKAHPTEGHVHLVEALAEAENMSAGAFVAALLDSGVSLVPAERIEGRQWLAPDGNYSFDFQRSCIASLEDYEVTFYEPTGDDKAELDDEDQDPQRSHRTARLSGTRDQSVVTRIVASAPDERIAIDAYAGTGKTFLVHALKQHFRGGFTYIAPTKAQIYGYESRSATDSYQATITLGQLAGKLAKNYARTAGLHFMPNMGRSEYPLAEQAQMAGVSAIGSDSVDIVMRRLYTSIRSWCYTDDQKIGERHFLRTGARNLLELPRYIHAANRLWQAMFSRVLRNGQAFDIWHDQIAKWLMLQNAAIPARFGTLLVDEAHDLSPVWWHLFDNYLGGCVLMGDPHQRLRGLAIRSHRAQSACMTTSLRIGIGADDIVERTLRLAPERVMPEFQSARDHITRLRTYADPRNIPDHGLRLYGNEWALLETALRMKAAGAPIKLLPSSKRVMEESVRNALALFDGRILWHGIKVYGCSNWEDLAAKLSKQSLSAIIRMFERGFDEGKLSELIAYEAQAETSALTLGLIDHSKNLEFGAVALAPCCYDDASIRRGFQPIHASYLGMTRARHELWVPGDALDRLLDLQASSSA